MDSVVGVDPTTAVVGTASHSGTRLPRWYGRRVGRYRLLSELGKGSAGKVFEAEDVDLGRHVALKVISNRPRRLRRASDSKGGSKELTLESKRVQRLIAEAKAAARLQHPFVVGVYEVAGVSDVYYIAMELVPGGCLRTRVEAEGPMAVGRACRLACEAAQALQYAHDNGIVHRDVKPANLMVTRDDRCKLGDFGLACEIDPGIADDGGDEEARPSVGTPLYIAPEVIRNQGATPRSDIYSLGGTLWFLLTGKPPYPRDLTALILAAHLLDPLPDLRKLRSGLPDGLVKAVNRALSKDPADRFESAEEFAAAVRPYAEAAPGAAPSKHRRHGLGWYILVALVVTIVAATVAFFVGQRMGMKMPTLPGWGVPPDVGTPPPDSPGGPATGPAGPADGPAWSDADGPPGPRHVLRADRPAELLRIADGLDDDEPPTDPVTVEGQVFAVGPSTRAKFYWVHFSPPDEPGGFACTYPPELDSALRDRFPPLAGVDGPGLIGKRVRVTGRLERFKDRPQILIESPDQVKVVE